MTGFELLQGFRLKIGQQRCEHFGASHDSKVLA